MTGSTSLLSVKNLSVSYGGVQAVSAVSLEVPPASCVAIIGANGAGKTSMLRGIGGLERCSRETRIVLEATELRRLSADKRARLGLGHVLEHRHLFPNLTVRENLLLGGIAAGTRGGSDDLDIASEIFPAIRPLYDMRAAALSGGQQQFVAIARSLMGKPRVLLLDEPTVGLAPRLIEDVENAVRALVETGTSVVLVEQRLQVVQAVADVVHVLIHSKLTDTLKADDETLEAVAQRAYLS